VGARVSPREIRVRFSEVPPSALMPRRVQVFEWESGRDLSGFVPLEHAEVLLGARPGDRLVVSIFTDDPAVYDPWTQEARRETVTFCVVAVERLA
jgi:hypothetical protein